LYRNKKKPVSGTGAGGLAALRADEVPIGVAVVHGAAVDCVRAATGPSRENRLDYPENIFNFNSLD
jgi:hypothetical protein